MLRKLAFLRRFPAIRFKPLLSWVLILSAASLIGYGLWFFVGEFPKINIPSTLNEKEKRELINSNRENVLKVIQTLAGLGFIGTAFLAWRNSQLTEDKNVADRFTKAVEMLSDKERLEVRIGGIYTLERIAKDSKKDSIVVTKLLLAFVRRKTRESDYIRDHSPWLVDSECSIEDRINEENYPEEDIQICLEAVVSDSRINQNITLSLDNANLQNANLFNYDLSNFSLKNTNLVLAFLQDSKLNGSLLIDTMLMKADLRYSEFKKAVLVRVDFSNSDLRGADFREAHLEDVIFDGADVEGAIFEGATIKDNNYNEESQGIPLHQLIKKKGNESE